MLKGIFMVLAVVIIFTTTASASSGWFIYHESAFKGKVIDAETKEPIAGAVVVAIYHIREYGIADSGRSEVDAKEVLTNKNGEFYIQPHTFFSLYPVAKGEVTTFLIYKPGYTAFGNETNYFGYFPASPLNVGDDGRAELFKKGVTVELMKLETREERKENIPSGPIDLRAKKLPLFLRSINDERKRFGFEEVE